MSEVGRWLDERRPVMPRELREAVDAALEGIDGDGAVADQLAEGALGTLARVVRSPSDRAGALELLAADALLTYACEAAADEGPGGVDRVVAGLDVARFSALLEEGPG